MPVKLLIETKIDSFPDTGTAAEYAAAMAPVLDQVGSVIAEFATHRVDRKVPLLDKAGKPCGEIEVLRF